MRYATIVHGRTNKGSPVSYGGVDNCDMGQRRQENERDELFAFGYVIRERSDATRGGSVLAMKIIHGVSQPTQPDPRPMAQHRATWSWTSER